MAGRTRHASLRHSILMLLTIMTANTSASHARGLHPKRADTCSGSSQKCSGAGLLDDFCCSSGSTCVGLDGGSSVICCPDGQDCTYIEPITCDISKQDASLHPDNVIKTTRLDDELPSCGKSCCPFGYTCQGKFCAMEEASSSSSTSTRSTTTKTTETPTSTPTTTEEPSTETADITDSSTTTTTQTTPETTDPDVGAISTITPDASPTVITLSTPTLSQYSAASDNNSTSNIVSEETTCPAFPTNAVLAGFFPGSVFGAVAALLLTVCIRRHQRNRLPPVEKVAQNTYRKSTGTLMGISDPIPSDESSFRTDFLLRTNPRRNSEGARSVLQRSRSRVKSLFGGGPKPNPATGDDIPAVPPVPTIVPFPDPHPNPMTPPRQRQPSTESIRVYTPPSVFNSNGVINQAPYSDDRPNTTLTEILDRAQAQMEAQSSANGGNNKTSSTATGANQRFLLPPVQNTSRRKPLPY
ncbi:hypothetical protein BJY04DRAFT_179638 [Aspergillus karnatakaensis]|uniref:uncharacterized protein n=1 Tax=Aspergillus karnatakaensis TaxID=1810916 RepID=UPI003CCD2A22